MKLTESVYYDSYSNDESITITVHSFANDIVVRESVPDRHRSFDDAIEYYENVVRSIKELKGKYVKSTKE